jgi:hypothetical protein
MVMHSSRRAGVLGSSRMQAHLIGGMQHWSLCGWLQRWACVEAAGNGWAKIVWVVVQPKGGAAKGIANHWLIAAAFRAHKCTSSRSSEPWTITAVQELESTSTTPQQQQQSPWLPQEVEAARAALSAVEPQLQAALQAGPWGVRSPGAGPAAARRAPAEFQIATLP